MDSLQEFKKMCGDTASRIKQLFVQEKNRTFGPCLTPATTPAFHIPDSIDKVLKANPKELNAEQELEQHHRLPFNAYKFAKNKHSNCANTFHLKLKQSQFEACKKSRKEDDEKKTDDSCSQDGTLKIKKGETIRMPLPTATLPIVADIPSTYFGHLDNPVVGSFFKRKTTASSNRQAKQTDMLPDHRMVANVDDLEEDPLPKRNSCKRSPQYYRRRSSLTCPWRSINDFQENSVVSQSNEVCKYPQDATSMCISEDDFSVTGPADDHASDEHSSISSPSSAATFPLASPSSATNSLFSRPSPATNSLLPSPSSAAKSPLSSPLSAANSLSSSPSSAANFPLPSPSSTANSPLSSPFSAANSPLSSPSSAKKYPLSSPSSTANSPLSSPSSAAKYPLSSPSSTANSPLSSPSSAKKYPLSSPSSTANSPLSSPSSATNYAFLNPPSAAKERIRGMSKATAFLGELKFEFKYLQEKNSFRVRLIRGENIGGLKKLDYNMNIFLKVYLMPGKIQIQSSEEKRHTKDPNFDEEFFFTKLSLKNLQVMSLRIKVYNNIPLLPNECIGEINLALGRYDLSRCTRIWRNIEPKVSVREDLGHLFLSLKLDTEQKKMDVTIGRATGLLSLPITGSPNPYVSVEVSQDFGNFVKKRTKKMPNTAFPVFKETLTFDLNPENIDKIRIVITVVSDELVRSDIVLGEVRLGYDSTEDSEVLHWQEIKQCPGRDKGKWHYLMESGEVFT